MKNRIKDRLTAMNKHLVALGAIVMLTCVGLSGCADLMNLISPEKNKFIGTWTGSDYDYVFSADNTFSAGDINGSWELKDGMLVLTLYEQSQLAYTYVFSNNDTRLTLTIAGGTSSEVFTKQ